MMTDESLKHTLAPVLRVLRDLGGKFVFSDDEGNSFVLMAGDEVPQERSMQEQLPLLETSAVEAAVRQHAPDISDDVIDAINRDLALASQSEVEIEDDLAIEIEPAPKIRFEPLKGDLPPQLQE